MNPEDQKAADEVLEAMTGETDKEIQGDYSDGAYTISFINGQPGLVVRGNHSVEMSNRINAILPVFKRFRDAVDTGRAEKAKQAQQNSPQTQQLCPKCGGEMWDNRPKKETGEFKFNSPDFKCKNKQCGGVIWPPKN